MSTGVLLLVLGVVMVVSGMQITKTRVRGEYGEINSQTMRMSEGAGLVPSWVSALVLGGYAVSIVGVLVVVVAAVSS